MGVLAVIDILVNLGYLLNNGTFKSKTGSVHKVY